MADIRPIEQKALETKASAMRKPDRAANDLARQRMAELKAKQGAESALRDQEKKIATGLKEGQIIKSVENLTDPDPAVQTDARETAAIKFRQVSAYVESGYDALGSVGEQETLRNQVLDKIDTSPWASSVVSGLSPDQRQDLATGFLQDGDFQKFVNRRLQRVAGHNITKRLVDTRLKEMQAIDPTATDAQARKALESEWQEQVNNVIGDSVEAYLNQSLNQAAEVLVNSASEIDADIQRISGEQGMKIAENVTRGLMDRWSNQYDGKFNSQEDFELFCTGGVDGLLRARTRLTDEQRNLILNNPDIREKLQNQLSNSVVLNRFRSGAIAEDDVYRLATTNWLDSDPVKAMEKFVGILERNDKIRALIKDQKEKGVIKKGFWERIASLPRHYQRGFLMMLLAALALPAAGASAALTKWESERGLTSTPITA